MANISIYFELKWKMADKSDDIWTWLSSCVHAYICTCLFVYMFSMYVSGCVCVLANVHVHFMPSYFRSDVSLFSSRQSVRARAVPWYGKLGQDWLHDRAKGEGRRKWRVNRGGQIDDGCNGRLVHLGLSGPSQLQTAECSCYEHLQLLWWLRD